ncbi:MAG: hypothetical protein WD960_10325 [Gemmatimonadota bacterium]
MWLSPSRSGFILPVALLLLLGGTLVAMSLLITARSTILLADGDRILAVALADRGPFNGPGHMRVPEDADLELQGLPLVSGFGLLEAVPAGSGESILWRSQAVGWSLSPESVAHRIQAAITLGGTVRGEGHPIVGSEEHGCANPLSVAAVQPSPHPRPPVPDPPLAAFPRLGPVGMDAVLHRSEMSLEGVGDFPMVEGSTLFGVRDTSTIRVTGGRARGFLAVPGDLVLEGEASFEGLAMIGGDLSMEDGASFAGAALVGGDVELARDARFVGCLALAGTVVAEIQAFAMPFPVPGGEFLGRF